VPKKTGFVVSFYRPKWEEGEGAGEGGQRGKVKSKGKSREKVRRRFFKLLTPTFLSKHMKLPIKLSY